MPKQRYTTSSEIEEQIDVAARKERELLDLANLMDGLVREVRLLEHNAKRAFLIDKGREEEGRLRDAAQHQHRRTQGLRDKLAEIQTAPMGFIDSSVSRKL